MKINPLENKIAESKTTQNKRNSTHSTQINENNDSTNNNKIVEIQISDEAKKLNQTDSKKEKNYEITVSQVKIKDQKKDSEQGKDTSQCPKRASKGPKTSIEARILRTMSYLAMV